MAWVLVILAVIGICVCLAMADSQEISGKELKAEAEKRSKAKFLIEYARLLSIEFPDASHLIHESSVARFVDWWHSHQREYFKNLTDRNGEIKPDRVDEYRDLFTEKVGELISPELAQMARRSPAESHTKFRSAWSAARTLSGSDD